MNRLQTFIWMGSIALVAATAAPALARGPYAYNPYVYNGGMGYNPAPTYNTSYVGGALGANTQDIDASKNNLAVQINQGYATRRIAPNEAQRLTNDLNKISQREVNYLSSNGGALTGLQHARLQGELVSLGMRVNKDVATGRTWR